MYRSILAVACAVLAVSCVKNPGSETPDPGTDTPDVSHFQTAEQYTVPTKAGQITTVKMNGVTLAEASSPMKIWIPRYARTKAAAAPEVIYTPADEYPNGFAGNKAQLFQVVCFEDSRSGDYDYNDLVIHVKYQWNGTRFGFGVHPIALGSTKEVRLGAVVYKGSTRIFKGLLAPGNADARTQYFQSQAGFINTGTDRQINQRIDGRVTGWNQYLGSTCRCWDLSKIADDGAVRVEWYGAPATDWANDGVFGDGWHLLGIGSSAYNDANDEYTAATEAVDAFLGLDTEAEDFDADATLAEMKDFQPTSDTATTMVEDEETLAENEMTAYYDNIPDDADKDSTVGMTYVDAVAYLEANGFDAPDPADYGVWVPGIPVLIGNGLEKAGCADWLQGLILDGIVAGVGAVLGFVPQMLVLFLMLAFLEACGYMSRIAFVLDRIFRKFGLSGKSFIPMLIGVGCGVPGVMASRTIENERDRRMTIMTTTFIPCGAKVPFIGMIAGALFGGSAWVSTSAYFIGMAAIIVSGIMLKKTKMFAGDPAPFVMELPAYHWPTLGNVLRSMWERGWSFIKKAGTIILLSTILVWFTTYFGTVDGTFRMLSEDEIDYSILAAIGGVVAWIFKPLGWGNWQAAVASITGLVAKENIVGTLGILYGGGDGTVYQNIAAAFNGISGYSFLVFNLLCAPCFAAIGAIKREMNSQKWTWFAIGYQCGFAYLCGLMIYQFGCAFTGNLNVIGLICAILALAGIIYMLVRPYKEATTLKA